MEVVSVKFSNLPKGKFMKNLFLSQLKGKLLSRRRKKTASAAEQQEIILDCVHEKSSNSVVVKFSSRIMAEKIVQSQMEFLSTTLLVEMIDNAAQSKSDSLEVEESAVYMENTLHEEVGDEGIAGFEEDEDLKSPAKKRLDVKSTPKKTKQTLNNINSDLNNYFKNLSCIGEPTKEVEISNLPDDYKQVTVLYVINDALVKAKFCERSVKPAKECTKTGTTTAIVQFTSVAAATKICSLPIDYDGKTVVTRQVEHVIETKPADPLPQLTSKVKVYGLPTNFEVVNVLYILNNALYEEKFCRPPEKPAEACRLSDETTATVEFSSVEAASLIVLLKVDYEGRSLVLEQLSSLNQSINQSQHSMNYDWNDNDILELSKHKSSDTVEICGLTASFTATEFKRFLLQEMVKAKFLTQENSDAIVKCEMNSSKKSAVVQFSTAEEATLATHLENMTVTKVILNDNSNRDLFPEEVEEKITLNDEEGSNFFLKVLARKRGDVPKSGSHDNFLESLTGYLEKKGVNTDIHKMRSKKETMRENFRRWKQKNHLLHPLFKIHSVIFDNNTSISILKGSKFEWTDADEALLQQPETDDRYMDDLIKFSEAASWNINSELALVQACLDNKEDYNAPKAKRSIHFWRKISEALYRNKYIHGAQKCEQKMEMLSRDYRDYCDEANRTGACGPLEMIKDRPTRNLMELMHELKRKEVGSHPEQVQGAGVKLVHHKSKKSPESAPGRTRPTSMPRNQTAQQVKTEIEMEKLQILKQLSSHLAKGKKD
ncbi:hypothetical protein FOCC_FOCC001909 [Frankliniella occidentalis]|uniref:Uncharacterized protein LOC113207367 n=1 Tax=Frankliniella occidentalis TaxID=133901 RepID=A0A9C6XDX3_FRAOC|nr:uncharacterized protein LOC113207367 [Frankliniella occidentalis]KAE8751338.1 hypothetical protein FOCC_FOCC001909 [Frankliniella occidentalis]